MSTIGNSSPSQNTINYDALLTTTLMAYRKKMVDNIFKSSAFLAALKQYDGIDYQDGGERVQMLLMYGKNSTVKSYKGYDLIDTTPQEGITSAFYPWVEIAGSISISRREERQNSGEAAILNLLKQKIMQAEMSIKEAVNTQLVQGTVSSATFVPGNGGLDLLPLGYFLPSDCTANPSGTGVVNVGDISREAYDWWRPVTCNFNTTVGTGEKFGLAVTTYALMKAGLHRLWNYCSRGADGSGPNIILADQISAETYENALDTQKRYGDEKLANMGFDTVKCKGGTMMWDETVPDIYTGTTSLTTGTVFMLNTKFYKLIIDKQTDFVTTDFIEPENQTAKVAKVLFMGQAACSNMKKQGCAKRISQSIAS